MLTLTRVNFSFFFFFLHFRLHLFVAKLYCLANYFKFYGDYSNTVMTLSFQTDRSGQTEGQSDQGLHCLLFHLHLLETLLEF